jgi:sulfide:quinone oxidoreductase
MPAMYLSCDIWKDKGSLGDTTVEFLNAGPGLFGVADYGPPLMEYVKAYGINLSFEHNLSRSTGSRRRRGSKRPTRTPRSRSSSVSST